MNVRIYPCKLKGSITPPPSKSQAHRLIIAAALSNGNCKIQNLALSKDISATINCMRSLGALIDEAGNIMSGVNYCKTTDKGLPILDCFESGSTLRFLIPIALAVAGGGVFRGQGRLLQRPQGPYKDIFLKKGIRFYQTNTEICVEGILQSGEYSLPGNVSSQFITGLMYALPLLDGDSDIILESKLESQGYVDMTIHALNEFGIQILEIANGWHIPGNQKYIAKDCVVEADYSQAGFYYAACGIGNDIKICGLNPNSHQGDRVIVDYYDQLLKDEDITIDVSQCPDLVPPIAAFAALRFGLKTSIVGAARLRMKESDRLETVSKQLSALGAQIEEGTDSLMIRGVQSLNGGIVSASNDHRIAMMMAIAATRAEDIVTVEGAECVSKSYPNFWDDFEKLGGIIERE